MAQSGKSGQSGKEPGKGDRVRDMVARRRRELAEREARRASGPAPASEAPAALSAPPSRRAPKAPKRPPAPSFDVVSAPASAWTMARLARLALPLVALLIIGAVFWTRSVDTGDLPVGMADLVEIKTTGKLSNPHFTGATKKGEPVTLRAIEARPDGLDFNQIDLSEVSGEVQLLDGRTVSLTAAKGLYDRAANGVSGWGGVVISTSDGYRLTTEKLSADVDALTAVSETPVTGEGPEGRITADAMRLEMSEDVTAIFEGNVRVVISRLVESRATGE